MAILHLNIDIAIYGPLHSLYTLDNISVVRNIHKFVVNNRWLPMTRQDYPLLSIISNPPTHASIVYKLVLMVISYSLKDRVYYKPEKT